MSAHIPWKWTKGPTGAFALKEPLAWQRLEPHSRNSDFSNGIQAPIHDALWMLTRQWQLGEFEGEDAGSPVYVKIDNRAHKISKIISDRNNEFDYHDGIPLEAFVERTKLEVATQNEAGVMVNKLDLQMRVRLGLQFQREMDDSLKNIIDDKELLRKFKKYLAQDTDLKFELNEFQDTFEVELTRKFVSVVKGRVIDISRIIDLNAESILASKTTQYFIDNPPPNTDPALPSKVISALASAISKLKGWWYGSGEIPEPLEESFFERPPNDFTLWKPEQLEYSFKVKIIPNGSSENLILNASEYKEDHLDWYSFTVSESTQDFQLPPVESRGLPVSTNLIVSGMPEKRWWDFDEGFIDFGMLNPRKNNIISLLLTEFALVHSSDWYIIPYTMEVGTINQIEKLSVTDCFGDETTIEPAGRTSSELDIANSDDTWDSWSMFSLSKRFNSREERHNTPYFFLPPTADHVLSGNSLEEIKLLRDETANLVWAVEKIYKTYYGEPVSGYDHYFLLQQIANHVSPVNDNRENSDKDFKYTVMTGAPWNWIPFIPVHKSENSPAFGDPAYRHIKLQRASMINPIDGTSILPNSRIINEVNPYYIDESEIPRSGIILYEKYQRTVWHNGKVFLWIGRKKSIGAGEGSSGLQFDSISLAKKV